MTKDDIIRMAREAGLHLYVNDLTEEPYALVVERFANLVAAAEPTCPSCKAAVLYECVACSSNNYPPQQQAEPVAQRPWQGLTDEEIHRTTVLLGFNPEWKTEIGMAYSIVRNLEAKLKERNT